MVHQLQQVRLFGACAGCRRSSFFLYCNCFRRGRCAADDIRIPWAGSGQHASQERYIGETELTELPVLLYCVVLALYYAGYYVAIDRRNHATITAALSPPNIDNELSKTPPLSMAVTTFSVFYLPPENPDLYSSTGLLLRKTLCLKIVHPIFYHSRSRLPM